MYMLIYVTFVTSVIGISPDFYIVASLQSITVVFYKKVRILNNNVLIRPTHYPILKSLTQCLQKNKFLPLNN